MNPQRFYFSRGRKRKILLNEGKQSVTHERRRRRQFKDSSPLKVDGRLFFLLSLTFSLSFLSVSEVYFGTIEKSMPHGEGCVESFSLFSGLASALAGSLEKPVTQKNVTIEL